MSEYEKLLRYMEADPWALVPLRDNETVLCALRLAARQPSPSAKETMLKKLIQLAEEEWDEQPSGEGLLCGKDAVLDFLHMPEVADTLDNESAAAQELSAIDRSDRGRHEQGETAPAADPAPEARELTRESIERWREWIRLQMPSESSTVGDMLCDMALRSLDLEQALARAQEELTQTKERAAMWAASKGKILAMYENAAAELAKVREALSHIRWIKDCGIDGRDATGLFINFADQERDEMYKIACAALASVPSAREGQTEEQNGEGKP